jgi:iron complex transport system ATP-binding protein
MMYQASDIRLVFHKKAILHDAHITLTPGTFTAVVGPNGAGKSTLLKAMAFEHRHFHGDVTINGKSIRAFRSKELSQVRAVLPQQVQIQFSFTVEQMVTLGRYAHTTSKKENENVVEEVMALTDISMFRHRHYATLSGGERQRVQLARVLAQVWEEKPFSRYILLDEPTSSLDIAQQRTMFALAKQVCDRNIGVMAIVHDLNLAVQYAEEIYFMCEGRVTAAGPSLNVFTKTNIENAFRCPVSVYHDPCTDCPYIVPAPSGMWKAEVYQ